MPKKVLKTLFFASIHSVIELVEMLFLFFYFFILHQAAASFNLQLYRLQVTLCFITNRYEQMFISLKADAFDDPSPANSSSKRVTRE